MQTRRGFLKGCGVVLAGAVGAVVGKVAGTEPLPPEPLQLTTKMGEFTYAEEIEANFKQIQETMNQLITERDQVRGLIAGPARISIERGDLAWLRDPPFSSFAERKFKKKYGL